MPLQNLGYEIGLTAHDRAHTAILETPQLMSDDYL